MLTMPLGVASEAACIAAPRSATTRSAGFKIDHAGKHQRRVFAQTQAGGEAAAFDDVGRFLFQRFQRRQRRDKQRRLAVNR